MHNTEIKAEIGGPQQQQELSLHGQNSLSSPTRRMTNGDGVIAAGSRHLRDGPAPGLAVAPNECSGCGKRITDRFLLKALDLFWHEDCLKCGCCDCRLGEVGSTLYTKANLILCKRDYLRLFGSTGYCAACSKVIPAFEMVMRAKNNVYHLECFACQQCNHRFCVGDRFYLCENKILCEYDYEERMVFANMACSPGNLAILRRQSGSQGERPQQLQLQSSSNSIAHNSGITEQYLRFEQQRKYPNPPPKVPVSEPHISGVNPSNPQSPPSSPTSSSSHQYCAQAGYITKKARARQCTDSFNNEQKAGSTTMHSKRTREMQPSFDDDGMNDNPEPNLHYQVQYERNNNRFENNEKTIVTAATSSTHGFDSIYEASTTDTEDRVSHPYPKRSVICSSTH